MPKFSAFFVRQNIAQFGNGVDHAALYAIAGITEQDATNPGTMVEDTAYYALLEELAQTEQDNIGFHMRTSASMSCDAFGAVGLAWKSAPTLRQSFSRMDRHARLYNEASIFALEDRGASVRWTHHRPEPERLGTFLSNEAALGTFMTLCREACPAGQDPSFVQFRHDPIGTSEAVERHFRCPVRYGADTDAIEFTKSQLDIPNAVGDASIWQFILKHLQELLPDEQNNDNIEKQVIMLIADLLSNGAPTLEEVASRLGIGQRTLQRRLADAGVNFQDLVDEARRKLTTQLLGNTGYSLAEIAFLAGFSDQSAFTRAFKRCFGKTPRAWRQESTIKSAQGAKQSFAKQVDSTV